MTLYHLINAGKLISLLLLRFTWKNCVLKFFMNKCLLFIVYDLEKVILIRGRRMGLGKPRLDPLVHSIFI